MNNREEIIKDLITRGVGEFIDPEGVFLKKLKENPEKIVIKFGVDPTRPDIHLGHAVVLRKLRQFQNLGCKVVFLVGDFTARIGDPTGKDKVRPEIDYLQIEGNTLSFIQQIDKILKVERNPDSSINLKSKVFSWIRNSDWFDNPTDYQVSNTNWLINYSVIDRETGDFLKNPETGKSIVENKKDEAGGFLGKAFIYSNNRMQAKIRDDYGHDNVSLNTLLFSLKHITHQQLIERDMFQKRIEENRPLFMHEMMYPVLQGTDSYVINLIYGSCDLEIGGTDQIFNMKIGRDIQLQNRSTIIERNKAGANLNPDLQAIMPIKLLVGTDGKEKMSKSLDNYIAITDEPNDMYGKVMSIPDTAIFDYFELCTFTPLSHIEEMKDKMDSGSVNPRDLKMELARQIVTEYHGEKKAKEAEDDFVKKFQKGEIPENIETIEIEKDSDPREVFVSKGIAKSKSELKRLFDGGGVTNIETKEKVSSPEEIKNGTYKFGSKSFYKINKK